MAEADRPLTRGCLDAAMAAPREIHAAASAQLEGALGLDALMGAGGPSPERRQTFAVRLDRYWPDLEVLRGNWHRAGQWLPAMDPGRREAEYANWRRAVERSLGWIRTADHPQNGPGR